MILFGLMDLISFLVRKKTTFSIQDCSPDSTRCYYYETRASNFFWTNCRVKTFGCAKGTDRGLLETPILITRITTMPCNAFADICDGMEACEQCTPKKDSDDPCSEDWAGESSSGFTTVNVLLICMLAMIAVWQL